MRNCRESVNALPVSKWLNAISTARIHVILLEGCFCHRDQPGLLLLPQDSCCTHIWHYGMEWLCPTASHKTPPIHPTPAQVNEFVQTYVLGFLWANYLCAGGWLGITDFPFFFFLIVKRREVPITSLYLHSSWSDEGHKSHIDQQDLTVCYPFCWTAARL